MYRYLSYSLLEMPPASEEPLLDRSGNVNQPESFFYLISISHSSRWAILKRIKKFVVSLEGDCNYISELLTSKGINHAIISTYEEMFSISLDLLPCLIDLILSCLFQHWR